MKNLILIFLFSLACPSAHAQNNTPHIADEIQVDTGYEVYQLDYANTIGVQDEHLAGRLNKAAQAAWAQWGYKVTSVGRNLVPVLNHPIYRYQFTFTVEAPSTICDGFVDEQVTRILSVCRYAAPIQ